jgi:hypothetical protein
MRPRAGDVGERGVADVERQVVACCLEHRQRLLDERGERLRAVIGHEIEAEAAGLDPSAELAEAIAGGSGSLGERLRTPDCLVSSAGPGQDLAKLALEGDVNLRRQHQPGGALEQPARGEVVLPARGALTGVGKPPARRAGQLGVVAEPDLGAVEHGLLEVVAVLRRWQLLRRRGPTALTREAAPAPQGFRHPPTGCPRLTLPDQTRSQCGPAEPGSRSSRPPFTAHEGVMPRPY